MNSTFVVLENSQLKINFLLMKGENFITSYCIVLSFKLAKIRWLVKMIVFWSVRRILFMNDDSRHEVDDADDGWVLGSE